MKRNSNIIETKLLSLAFVLACFASIGQTVTEDFDHNDISTLQSYCWESSDFYVTDTDSINAGASSPIGVADLDGSYSDSASLTSPYIYFDGTGNITFNHKMSAHNGSEIHAGLQLQVISTSGIVTTVFSHDYKDFGVIAAPAATVTQSESVAVVWNGYYRIRWKWSATANVDTSTSAGYGDAYIDDIAMSGTFSADSSAEYNGYCPGIFYLTDSVCSGESDVAYSPLGADPTIHSYSWSFTGTSGGTIDNSITANDDVIQVDWNMVTGSYQLLAQESSIGMYQGNKTYYDVYVGTSSVSAVITQGDTVCDGGVVPIKFTFTGTGPFQITFDDELGSHSATVSGTTYTYVPSGHIDNIDVTSLKDGYGCSPASLPSLWLYYFVNPSTGLIVRW